MQRSGHEIIQILCPFLFIFEIIVRYLQNEGILLSPYT